MSSRATQPPAGWRQRAYETFWLRTLEKIFMLTEISTMGLYCSPRAGRRSSRQEMAAVNSMSPFLVSAGAPWQKNRLEICLYFHIFAEILAQPITVRTTI